MHITTNPTVSAVTTQPVATADGGTSFSVVVPSTGYSQSFVTKPVPPGTIAIPTNNLTTGTSFDQINLVPGTMGDVGGAGSGPNGTDFLLMVPGQGGGIAGVHSSNEKVIPSVPPITKSAQAQALDIGNPLMPGVTLLQVTWVDATGAAQTSTFSITAT